MEKANRLLVAFLFVLSGCGGVVAQANNQPQVAPPADLLSRYIAEHPQPAEPPMQQISVGCPPGTPFIKCGKLRNGLGNGLAIVYVRVNDEAPIIMNPNGGTLPLPRLLPGQTTDFTWPRCTRRNFRGECLNKFVGIAFPVIDMTGQFPEVDSRSEDAQLLIQADLDPYEAVCFEKEVAVTVNMRQNGLFVPSIQPEDVLKECPSGMVPKGTTFSIR